MAKKSKLLTWPLLVFHPIEWNRATVESYRKDRMKIWRNVIMIPRVPASFLRLARAR